MQKTQEQFSATSGIDMTSWLSFPRRRESMDAGTVIARSDSCYGYLYRITSPLDTLPARGFGLHFVVTLDFR